LIVAIGILKREFVRETLNKSTFFGGSAQLCDAETNKIKDF